MGIVRARCGAIGGDVIRLAGQAQRHGSAPPSPATISGGMRYIIA
jgi:hypothetical protein